MVESATAHCRCEGAAPLSPVSREKRRVYIRPLLCYLDGHGEFFHRKTNMTYTAIIRKEEDWYVAECADTGTVSQGATIEEALANLKDATELYLEEFPSEQRGVPLLTTFEIPSASKSAVYA